LYHKDNAAIDSKINTGTMGTAVQCIMFLQDGVVPKESVNMDDAPAVPSIPPCPERSIEAAALNPDDRASAVLDPRRTAGQPAMPYGEPFAEASIGQPTSTSECTSARTCSSRTSPLPRGEPLAEASNGCARQYTSGHPVPHTSTMPCGEPFAEASIGCTHDALPLIAT
jgi:hypothetical protein